MNALRVLVAEDDPLLGEMLSEILVMMGHQVLAVVATEAEAVAAALRDWPDLMIVDAQLRASSGVAAMTEILRTRDVPYVLMSGAPVPSAQHDAVVLRKPFAVAGFALAIGRALGAQRPRG